MNNQLQVRNTLAYLLILLLVIVSVAAFYQVNVQTYPSASLPTYTIRATVPGMMPELIDEKVRGPLEEAVREIGHIEKITSVSQFGSVQLTVKTKEYIGSNYQEELTEKIAQIAKKLPGGAQNVQVDQAAIGDKEIGFFLLHGTDLQTLTDVAKYTVKEKLLGISGVSRVEVEEAAIKNNVELLFRPSMLQTYGLTPGDVIGQLQDRLGVSQIGSIGEEENKTHLQWVNQAANPQELGKTLISTQKGYIALKLLCDVRDLRGSRGESISLYNGDPFIGIHVYAQDIGQAPQVQDEVAKAISLLNVDAHHKYQLTQFADHNETVGNSVQASIFFICAAVVIASIIIGLWWKQVLAGVISFLASMLPIGAILGGMWASGHSVNVASLGPILVFGLFFIGASIGLFNHYRQLLQWNAESIWLTTKRALKHLLLSLIILFLIFVAALYTDFVKITDKPSLYDALPVFGWATIALLLVYGFIVPTLSAAWLQPRDSEQKKQQTGKVTGKIANSLQLRWERVLQLGYLPFGLTLTVCLLFAFFFNPFVIVDPYLKLDASEMNLSLQMTKGSTLDQAVQAAKEAEKKLRTISDIRDLYASATKSELNFHIVLQEKYERTSKKTEIDEAIDKALRDIPATDPYALVVGDDQSTRLEFYVKGPSLNTAKSLANQVLSFLQGQGIRDKDGKEMIYDEKISNVDDTKQIHITPKPEMLVRYQVSEAEVKNQLESYFGEQGIGNVYWNDKIVPLTARYPEKLMEHPSQVENVLIHTKQGAVRLADLAQWRYGPAQSSYQREDGLYVIKVSTAVTEQRIIPGLSYYLPIRMEKTVLIPEGYTIQSGEDVRKLEKEQSEKTDLSGRLFVCGSAVVFILVIALLLQRKLRYAFIAVLLLPILIGISPLALLIIDRSFNVMAFYGIYAIAALMIQQAFMLIQSMSNSVQNSDTLAEGVTTGTAAYLGALLTVLFAGLIGILPFATGWGGGDDFYGSFAAVVCIGLISLAWVLLVLVPGMFRASEMRANAVSEFNMLLLKQRMANWWLNYRVRRQDRKVWKQHEKRVREEQEKVQTKVDQADKELTADDFLPLSQ